MDTDPDSLGEMAAKRVAAAGAFGGAAAGSAAESQGAKQAGADQGLDHADAALAVPGVLVISY